MNGRSCCEKGKGKILAVILPNIRVRHYVDYYVSFKSYAENRGYTVLQYISNDNPETELAATSPDPFSYGDRNRRVFMPQARNECLSGSWFCRACGSLR